MNLDLRSFSFWMLILGLAMEVAVAVVAFVITHKEMSRKREETLKHWLEACAVLAGLLVLFAIIGEHVVSKRDETQMTTLSRRVAVAENRADGAEKAKNDALKAAAIASMMASSAQENAAAASTTLSKVEPRHIPESLRPELVKKLRDCPGRIQVECNMGDADGYKFGKELVDVLKESGWNVERDTVCPMGYSGMPIGLEIMANSNDVTPCVTVLGNLLLDVGLKGIATNTRPGLVRLIVGIKE